MEGREIVNPESNASVVLRAQLPREPPAHRGVAEVVDHPAENIPRTRLRHSEEARDRIERSCATNKKAGHLPGFLDTPAF
jgi:hypothetical protein